MSGVNMDEDQEIKSLLSNQNESHSNHAVKENAPMKPSCVRAYRPYLACLLPPIIALIFVGMSSYAKTSSLKTEVNNHVIPSYSCPATLTKALNDNTSDNFDWYTEGIAGKDPKTLEDIHEMIVDGWGIPVETIKEKLTQWKTKVFRKNLKSGDVIYESACGSGLNLLLTTQILKDLGIHNLTVYGNDYVPSSVSMANKIWDLPEVSEIAQKGMFCTGDSSNLDFVPSSSFDLVFTGYIDPMQDPLNLLPTTSSTDEKRENSLSNCRSDNPDVQKLAALEQSKQEDWYASWINELIRIAKPGKLIVAENNAEPLCQMEGDWGGVGKEWWKDAISKYGWDVDPESIFMRRMPRGDGWNVKRYHVMMRKNDAV